MKTAEDIESFLILMDAHYEKVGDDIWVLDDGGAGVVISIAGPVVVFRVKVLETERIPTTKREEFFRTLLEINASEMVHGAYGLEQGSVIATDALQLENLDFNEFQATIEDLGLAVSKHVPLLSKYAAEAA